MEGLRIWEADCALFDAVLSLSFEVEELLNCCQSAGEELASCPCHGRDEAVFGLVHRTCHEDTPLARLVERRLNVVHRRALARVESHGFDLLAQALGQGELYAVDDLAGKLWALTVSDHPQAHGLRQNVRGRLALTGLRLIARANARLRELADERERQSA